MSHRPVSYDDSKDFVLHFPRDVSGRIIAESGNARNAACVSRAWRSIVEGDCYPHLRSSFQSSSRLRQYLPQPISSDAKAYVFEVYNRYDRGLRKIHSQAAEVLDVLKQSNPTPDIQILENLLNDAILQRFFNDLFEENSELENPEDLSQVFKDESVPSELSEKDFEDLMVFLEQPEKQSEDPRKEAFDKRTKQIRIWLDRIKLEAFSEEFKGLVIKCAARHGLINIVQSLLKQGEIIMPMRIAALTSAVNGGHCAVVQVLLENGSIWDPFRDEGMEALSPSLPEEDQAPLSEEDEGPLYEGDLLTHSDKYLWASCLNELISMAIHKGRVDIFQLLIKRRKMSASLCDCMVNSAATNGRLWALYFLLTNDAIAAKKKLIMPLKERALRLAIESRNLSGGHPSSLGHINVCSFVKAFDDGRTDTINLLLAAETGSLDKVRSFLEGISSKEDIVSAAVTAAMNGHINIVQFFLTIDGGISENMRDEMVYAAARHRQTDIVRLLLENGKISERFRLAAIEAAAMCNCVDMLRLLLANGAITKDFCLRLASNAAAAGFLDVVQLLLANGEILESEREAVLAQVNPDVYNIF